MTAEVNNKVKVHYKGMLDNGEIFDTSEGREPLEFTLGKRQVIPGFDKGIQGMKVNESKTIKIPASEAYGEVKEELIQEVPNSALPTDIKPEIGLRLTYDSGDGQKIPLVVTEVRDETIIVDANHPLAGKNLTFEVKLMDIS